MEARVDTILPQVKAFTVKDLNYCRLIDDSIDNYFSCKNCHIDSDEFRMRAHYVIDKLKEVGTPEKIIPGAAIYGAARISMGFDPFSRENCDFWFYPSGSKGPSAECKMAEEMVRDIMKRIPLNMFERLGYLSKARTYARDFYGEIDLQDDLDL